MQFDLLINSKLGSFGESSKYFTRENSSNLSFRDGKLQTISIIGKGNFGKVYKVKNIEDEKVYAVKEIFIEGKFEKNFSWGFTGVL